MVYRDLRGQAVRAAVEVAAAHGLRECQPVVVADGFNVLVKLSPAPVVARVMTRTSMLRPRAEEHIAREIAVAEFLAARGIPAVRATRNLAPGPHRHAGLWLSLWEHLPVERSAASMAAESCTAENGAVAELPLQEGALDDGRTPSAAVVGTRLHDLHQALRDYPGSREALDVPISDIETFLRVGGKLSYVDDADLARARRQLERILARIDVGASPQCLHGDAHAGNLVRADGRWVWVDFEECVFGPVEWDLACLRECRRIDGVAALRAYGVTDFAALEPFRELRELQAAAWLSVLGERSPERRGRARELLDRLA